MVVLERNSLPARMVRPLWKKLHPDVKRRSVLVVNDANAEFQRDGLTVSPFDGWRSRESQLAHIRKGTSFVRDWRASYHPWGLAVDFVFVDGIGNWIWPTRESGLWDRLGEIIEKHGFAWGGRWNTFDGPHAQLPIAKVSDLIAAYGEPDVYVTAIANGAETIV